MPVRFLGPTLLGATVHRAGSASQDCRFPGPSHASEFPPDAVPSQRQGSFTGSPARAQDPPGNEYRRISFAYGASTEARQLSPAIPTYPLDRPQCGPAESVGDRGLLRWPCRASSYKQPVTQLATLDSRHRGPLLPNSPSWGNQPAHISLAARRHRHAHHHRRRRSQRRPPGAIPAGASPCHLTGGHSISLSSGPSSRVGETAPAPALRSWRGTSTGCSRPWSCSGSSDSATRSDFRVTSGPVWATRPAPNVLLSSNGRAPPAWFPFGLDGIGAYRRARAMPGPGTRNAHRASRIQGRVRDHANHRSAADSRVDHRCRTRRASRSLRRPRRRRRSTASTAPTPTSSRRAPARPCRSTAW